jgi:hypothetical protein
MADFGHIKSTKQHQAEYCFWNIVGEPTLIVRQAGEANKPYFNEILRQAEQMQRRKVKISADLIKANRQRDRELFPLHVVVGWKDVKDANGEVVPFSKDDCVAFLNALDDEEFDGLREFCKDGSNFRTLADGNTAAGNSQSA